MPRPDTVEGPAPAPADDPEPPRRLLVEVVEEAGDWGRLGEFEPLIAGVLAAAAAHPQLVRFMPAEACVALVDDATMRRLNGQFRAKDKPTNVLSFPAPAPAMPVGTRVLGDIALGFETVMREVAEQGKAPADHVRHLVLHGLLHLMGHDHETDADAEVMEALEIEILTGLGQSNPYAEAAVAPAGT